MCELSDATLGQKDLAALTPVFAEFCATDGDKTDSDNEVSEARGKNTEPLKQKCDTNNENCTWQDFMVWAFTHSTVTFVHFLHKILLI